MRAWAGWIIAAVASVILTGVLVVDSLTSPPDDVPPDYKILIDRMMVAGDCDGLQEQFDSNGGSKKWYAEAAMRDTPCY